MVTKLDKISSHQLEKILCPLCGTKKFTRLYPNHYPRLVTCSGCSLIYTNPRLKNEHLQKLYTKKYFRNDISSVFGYTNYQGDELKIRKTARKRLEKIERFHPPGKILDLGCATGFFLDEARQRGWEPYGVEISKFAASYATKQLKLDVVNGDLQSINFPAKSFDLITMWDVVEHITNPVPTFKKLSKLLKKDGMLVFSTPDVGSVPARITKHRWIGYKLSDEHLAYFSLPTIQNLLEQTGFELETVHHLGKYISFSLFADRMGIYSARSGKLLTKIAKYIPKSFNFYLSAFDIICVYARNK